MKEFISSSICVTVDESTGYITSIKSKNDRMNWVLREGEWGRVEHFGTQSVNTEGDRVVTRALHESRKLEITIEKYIENQICVG